MRTSMGRPLGGPGGTHRAYVLQNGRVVMEGAASALQSDLVDKAYLGL